MSLTFPAQWPSKKTLETSCMNFPPPNFQIPSVLDLINGSCQIASIPGSRVEPILPAGAITRKGTKNDTCLAQREKVITQCANQDNFLLARFHVRPSFRHLDEELRIYAVFDGHGLGPCRGFARDGDFFADAAAKLMIRKLWDIFGSRQMRESFLEGPVSEARVVLQSLFQSIDALLPLPRGGSTVTLFIHDPRRRMAYSAYVGDSRGIFIIRDIRGGVTTKWLTPVVHKPTSIEERSRLMHEGKLQFVNSFGRLGPLPIGNTVTLGLAVSRSLGDTMSEQYGKSCIPDVDKWGISDGADFAVLASDGVWDAMSDVEVARLVVARLSANPRPATLQEVAREVADVAGIRSRSQFLGLIDDITVIIVDLRTPTRRTQHMQNTVRALSPPPREPPSGTASTWTGHRQRSVV